MKQDVAPRPLRRALILMDGLDRPRRLLSPEDHPAFRLRDGLPVADHLVRHLAAQGITEIGMTIQQLPGLVVHYFADGAAWGVHVSYIYEQRPLGSGGAVAHAAGFCTETTLIVPGTLVTDVPMALLAAAHQHSAALVTAVLGTVSGGRPRPQCELDADGRLRSYLLPRAVGESASGGAADVGVYAIEPGLLGRLAKDTVIDWTREVMPELVKERLVHGWVSDALFLNVSEPQDLRLVSTPSNPGRSA